MKNALFMLPLAGLAALSGCAGENTDTPVTVDVPGMPSPELALQKSLDRINGFLGSLNQRIDTPVRQTTALAVTPSRPINLVPQAQAFSSPVTPPPAAPHEASPLAGKAGLTWFAYGDGGQILCVERAAFTLPGPSHSRQIQPPDSPSSVLQPVDALMSSFSIPSALQCVALPTAMLRAIRRHSPSRHRRQRRWPSGIRQILTFT